jgi:hypothetical protein
MQPHRPVANLYSISVREGDNLHTFGVVQSDLLSAIQEVERTFIHADPKDTRGEVIRAELFHPIHHVTR